MIDTFTDEHPATKEAKEFFRPHYRLYSGHLLM
jgi:acyl carrier protein phosphodiesterase